MPHILEITEDNAHAAIPPYMRPKAEPKITTAKKRSAKDAIEEMVLQYYNESSEPLTPDDCAALLEAHFNDGKPKVNSAGPAVFNLRERGLIRRTGLMKDTRNGSPAHAHELVRTTN